MLTEQRERERERTWTEPWELIVSSAAHSIIVCFYELVHKYYEQHTARINSPPNPQRNEPPNNVPLFLYITSSPINHTTIPKFGAWMWPPEPKWRKGGLERHFRRCCRQHEDSIVQTICLLTHPNLHNRHAKSFNDTIKRIPSSFNRQTTANNKQHEPTSMRISKWDILDDDDVGERKEGRTRKKHARIYATRFPCPWGGGSSWKAMQRYFSDGWGGDARRAHAFRRDTECISVYNVGRNARAQIMRLWSCGFSFARCQSFRRLYTVLCSDLRVRMQIMFIVQWHWNEHIIGNCWSSYLKMRSFFYNSKQCIYGFKKILDYNNNPPSAIYSLK